MSATELLPATNGRLMASNVKINLPAGDLLDLLTGAIIATERDKSLPTLTGINLVSDGESLTATATDRYRLITGKIKASGSPFTALLQNTDAAKVFARTRQ